MQTIHESADDLTPKEEELAQQILSVLTPAEKQDLALAVCEEIMLRELQAGVARGELIDLGDGRFEKVRP